MSLSSSRFILLLGVSYSITESLYNAALYKPVWQSSAFFPGFFGNDGNRPARNSTHFLCAHTSKDDPAWWMVDLNGHFVVEQIVFTNRDDNPRAALWIRNFQIEVFRADPRLKTNFLNISGDVCFRRTDPLPAGTYTWQCPTPITGRFVRLIRYTKEYLHVCELEVMVSRALERFNTFTRRLDTTLNVPITSSVSALTSRECAQQCLAFTNGSRCTAFNWIRSSNQCQLLSPDVRQSDFIISNLKPSQDVHFYVEVQ